MLISLLCLSLSNYTKLEAKLRRSIERMDRLEHII
jgi:hypothetical protein